MSGDTCIQTLFEAGITLEVSHFDDDGDPNRWKVRLRSNTGQYTFLMFCRHEPSPDEALVGFNFSFAQEQAMAKEAIDRLIDDRVHVDAVGREIEMLVNSLDSEYNG